MLYVSHLKYKVQTQLSTKLFAQVSTQVVYKKFNLAIGSIGELIHTMWKTFNIHDEHTKGQHSEYGAEHNALVATPLYSLTITQYTEASF